MCCFYLVQKSFLAAAHCFKIISITAGTLDSPWGNNSNNAWQEWNRSDFYSFEMEVSSLSSYLLPTHKKISHLPYWFRIFHVLIEEILSPMKFVTGWHLQAYKTPGFCFLLTFLVNSPSSGSTLRFPHSSWTPFLVNPLSFQFHPHQYHLVLPWLSKLFFKGCPLQLKRDFL